MSEHGLHLCARVCECKCVSVCGFLRHCKFQKKKLSFKLIHLFIGFFNLFSGCVLRFSNFVYMCVFAIIFSSFFTFVIFVEIRKLMMNSLESEEQQERHHETEKTHGFGQSESQDGIGEKLLFK